MNEEMPKHIEPASVFCLWKKEIVLSPHLLPPHSANVSETVNKETGR